MVRETLSVRIDGRTKLRLEAGTPGEAEERLMGEILAGIADTDAGIVVSQERVAKWLRSWGKPSEGKAPR